MEKCNHEAFEVIAHVTRLSADEGGPITGHCVDIQIRCAQCGLPFRFIGLPAGNHYAEPRVSVDGVELRAPIEPASHVTFQPATYTMPPESRH